MIYDLIVIGGGASGLTAAITAKSRGKKVLVLEKEQVVGSKILVTGNGKCNLTASNVASDKYNDPDFVREILLHESPFQFFTDLGLMLRHIDDRYYPYSESARSVVNLLLDCFSKEEIVYKEVKSLSFNKGLFSVDGMLSKNVALCTGSCATKGTASYALATPFGHTVSALRPAIVPLSTDTTDIRGLNGLRVKGSLALLQKEKKVAEEEGEILFRTYGVSGIAAMRLSSYIARHPGEYTLSVDFIPNREDALYFCEKKGAEGILVRPMANAVVSYAKKHGIKLMDALKDFRIGDVRLGPLSQAQVVCGGLNTNEFDQNLMSKLQSGLYAGGEVLNVDGECGGYNLHWAFASGLRIGKSV